MSQYYEIRTEDGQSIWDLAIQEYGSIEEVFGLLDANPVLQINNEPEAGTKINIEQEPDVQNREQMDYFRGNGAGKRYVNCRVDIMSRPGGIGFMQIGNDFIVS